MRNQFKRNIGSNSCIVSCDSGSVSIISAIMIPVLMAGLAICVDVAYWRSRSEQLQVIADIATLSLALDLTNNVSNVLVLQQHATGEAAKNGCTASTGCSVSVTYPYNGNPRSVSVSTTDANAKMFFAYLITSASKSLSGRAAAVASASPPSSASSPIPSCMLSLDTAGGSSGIGIQLQNTSIPASTNCGLVSDASTPLSLDIDKNATLSTISSAVGGIMQTNGGSMTAFRNIGVSAVADPYSQLASNFATVMRHSQFAVPNKQSQCIEAVDASGNVVDLNFSNPLVFPNDYQYGYQYSYDTNAAGSSRIVHTFSSAVAFKTGGGRFCGNVKLSPTSKVSLDVGYWFVEGALNLNGGLMEVGYTAPDATQRSIRSIQWDMPSAQLTSLDGGVLIVNPQKSFNLNGGTLNIRAPIVGLVNGVGLTQFSDDMTRTAWDFSTPGDKLILAGALYAPTKDVTFGPGSSLLGTGLGNSGPPVPGCLQVIASTIRINTPNVNFQNDVTSTTGAWCGKPVANSSGANPIIVYQSSASVAANHQGRLVPVN